MNEEIINDFIDEIDSLLIYADSIDCKISKITRTRMNSTYLEVRLKDECTIRYRIYPHFNKIKPNIFIQLNKNSDQYFEKKLIELGYKKLTIKSEKIEKRYSIGPNALKISDLLTQEFKNL